MALSSGSRLGSYDILALIGSGGMGEVYRALDSKLGREVAIKVLPAMFTRDPERLARFRRAAQVLASLNHPNIAHIHGIETADGVEFLVLELVDGETLADRIGRGALPPDEALPIAQQIGDALAAAHEKGIIHRDLKPANVALTADGQVKVLDFGLAKALEPEAAFAPGDLSAPPTITSPEMTALGVILGTAAYMSPEQAKGRPADKRSDIWAFGCVLFEMLTGRRAFDGEDVSDTLAAILRGEPDWSALPAEVPETVRLVLTKCLARDRRQRFADITTPLFLLTELPRTAMQPTSAAQPTADPHRRSAVSITAVALLAAAVTAAIAWMLWPAPSRPLVARFDIPLANNETFSNMGRQELAISRDGSRVAYVAAGHLYLRSMTDPEPRILASVEAGTPAGITSPVFSPDGEAIAYWSSDGLKRVSIAGGAPATLCAAENPFGMNWQGDFIMFGAGPGGIMRVSANGGAPEQIVKVAADERAYGPELLSDGDHVHVVLNWFEELKARMGSK
ncbi:MAG: protein kinase domain-containing protein [Vicinamibacterales bacterium]